ncbi:MAG TPA: M14 metallopeptidase family protein [Longimicrobiales bacterium]
MRSRLLAALAFCAVFASALYGQDRVTSPREQFGHEIGADYVLPNYQQLMAYWRKLDGESTRMIVQEIGKTAEGRPQLMAIVTSPANHQKLDRFREIARRMALADGVSEEEARALANEGRAVVWIDGGLHATEVLGAQQLMETVYQLVSRNDAETRRILDDVIVLAVHANPDGMDLVSDWYMRNPEATRRSTSGIPRLYQKYAGHDNNRDSYLNSQPETENMSRIQFREWFPHIVYNHHQTGPTGAVLFAPPFRDPFNFNMDPLIPAQLDAVGAAMHTRFIAEGKPGAVTRRGANYSTWWNGGVRTAVYFHNMIGLLTETIGNPTPIEIPFVPRYQLPTSDIFAPIAPTKVWKFRQSVDYSVTANYAILDYASRHREQLLYNIYHMGRNSIARGSTDTWTPAPWEMEKVQQLMAAQRSSGVTATEGAGGIRASRYDDTAKFYEMLRDPAKRDARGYILSAAQPDFPTATKFVNALVKSGITIHRATREFSVNGKRYPAGSYVVKTAQAFRPHVLDMFEPQQHPNDFQYPGGPPIAPYDNAGYTLAYQMGVQFDRILEGFDGPFEKIDGFAKAPAGRVSGRAGGNGGYTFSPRVNDSFIVVNRLLGAGADVYRLADGSFFVRNRRNLEGTLRGYAQELGVSFTGTSRAAGRDAVRLQPVRVALWDTYGGSMPSGWTRFLLERFEFPFEVVYPQTLNAGNLRAKYDVIILPDGSVPAPPTAGQGQQGGGGGGGGGQGGGPRAADLPEEFRGRLGRISADTTAPQLKAFLEQGGTIISVGGGTNIARMLNVPVSDGLVVTTDGKEQRLRREQFYVPGSVLEIRVDTRHPLAAGFAERVNVMFDESPVFRVPANTPSVRTIAWYEKDPLRSGWAWGQKYLENGAAAVEADVGKGTLLLFGPEITFRAQPHGTFKFLFNSIYYAKPQD